MVKKARALLLNHMRFNRYLISVCSETLKKGTQSTQRFFLFFQYVIFAYCKFSITPSMRVWWCHFQETLWIHPCTLDCGIPAADTLGSGITIPSRKHLHGVIENLPRTLRLLCDRPLHLYYFWTDTNYNHYADWDGTMRRFSSIVHIGTPWKSQLLQPSPR